MTLIRELQIINPDEIRRIAVLHKKAFPTFFLTQLGTPFLRTLYRCYLEDEYSGIILAEENDNVVGFVAYSKDYPKFFKGLIKRHLLKFAFCSLGAAIKHPSFIRRLLGAFKKSNSVTKDEKYVELASICVDPCVESKGIGTKLIDYLKSTVDFNTYAYINLETDAEDNDKANCFYIKNGFKLERAFTTPEGRKMNEYRYKGMDD